MGRIASAIRPTVFRGEGEPSPHPSPAALRAASVPEGLSPQPAEAFARVLPARLAALSAALFGAALIAAPETRAQPRERSPLVEAATRQRARILASRAARGPAPRFTDRDLGVPGRRAAPAPSAVRPPEPEAAPGTGADPDLVPEPDADSGRDPDLTPGADRPDPGATPAGRDERELRERLLDIEASLTAIGASGLPRAVRNPNRSLSGFDLRRLVAERDEIRRELEALAARKR